VDMRPRAGEVIDAAEISQLVHSTRAFTLMEMLVLVLGTSCSLPGCSFP